MVDFYAVLEVSKDATPEQIKRSYHRLALKYHPDKAGPDGAAKFKEVQVAYEVLSDPQKRSVYDTYGEAGLDAMDNPVAGSALSALGATLSGTIALLMMLLLHAMVLIFLAFLVSYVDGRLPSWNYVKVFSPLFVVDVLLGVPCLLLFVVFLVMSPRSFPIHCIFLAIFCAIILTIVIPIAKDRNEARMRVFPPNYLQWRVWLIPGYLFSVFVFIAAFFIALPSPSRIFKLKTMGLVRLANYLPIGFALTMLQAACVVIFFPLVACRADEVITTNYFVIIGVPVFVGLTLFLIHRFILSLLELHISEVPPEVRAAAQAQEEAANGGEPAPRADAENGAAAADGAAGAAPNPMRGNANSGAAREQQYSTATPTHSSPEGGQRPNGNGNDAQEDHDGAAETSGDGEGKNPYAGQHATCGGIVRGLLVSCLIVGLLMASTAMIVVRLNYYANYRSYVGVLTLAKACIPLFLIIGLLVLAILVGVLVMCCCSMLVVAVGEEEAAAAAAGAEAGNQQEAAEEGEQEMTASSTSSPAATAEEGAPAVPHQDADTAGRPAAAPRTSESAGRTPPENHPDNERLSDID